MQSPLEQWRPIAGFVGKYEVSNLGRIRNVAVNPPRIRNVGGASRYPQTRLTHEGRSKNVCVHAVVAEAFLGDRPNGCDISHIDGNPRNNAASNLVYESHSANCARRAEHGTAFRPSGEKHHNAKLTQDAVLEMRNMRARGALQREIAAAIGTTQSNVSRVLAGLQWKA